LVRFKVGSRDLWNLKSRQQSLAQLLAGHAVTNQSGQEDLNLRPHGPEPSGIATQTEVVQSVEESPAGACTSACTSEAGNQKANTVEALALALLALSPAQRAKLAAFLIGEAKE
jgi:hypothetical protein